jgi:hypothetical protein
MWDPEHLTALQASTGCCGHSFISPVSALHLIAARFSGAPFLMQLIFHSGENFVSRHGSLFPGTSDFRLFNGYGRITDLP